MAIKRPSKSPGTPVRRQVTSPGLKHVDLKGPQQLVAGDLYLGWLCKNKACARVLAIAIPPATGKPAAGESDDQLAALKCPHCGNEDLYRWGARGEHKHAPAGA